ncbi:MAG TPA: hypothetical protein PK544_16845 [Spirochaetota bacterium]|nr:hypothetical protein [Spirochaetota bacterium]HPQ55449.1 hypothetical protein [Spirochaetota bacterium]
MGFTSLSLKWSVECSNCRESLPVNKAAERILCHHCGEETDTPLPLWQRLVTPQLTEAIDMEDETDSWANGMMAGLGSYSMEFGKMLPRCEDGCGAVWPLREVVKIAERGAEHFTCRKCGKIFTVRKIPEFFSDVIPFARYIVGEESPEAEGRFSGSDEGIGMRCYHCGASLKLDGSSRKVHCTYCNNDLLVPDDIWQRLNPVITAHFWYILLDTGDHVGLLPVEIDDFLDLEVMPNGDTILLWEQDSTGHIGRSDRTNGLVWHTSEFEVNDYTRLLYDRGRNILWALHSWEHMVYCFDAATGRMIKSFVQDEDKEKKGIITAKDHEGLAICTDGTIVINRIWGASAVTMIVKNGQLFYPPGYVPHYTTMRRFNTKGREIPLWENQDNSVKDDRDEILFEKLVDRPSRIPEGAWLMGGPDNTMYVLDRTDGRTAVFDREGKLLHTIRPELDGVSRIQDAGVAADGSVYVLFDHRKKIRHENYSHAGRITRDGKFTLLAGPLCKKNKFPLGTELELMAVGERGEMHMCDYRMGIFRILNPDGSPAWKSLGTFSEDEEMEDHIAGRD